MPSRFVRVPHTLVIEPLEVMINQKMGRILSTFTDMTDGTTSIMWYNYNTEVAQPVDLDPEHIVEVDLSEELDRFILARQAERLGLLDLAAALREGDLDRAEELLRDMENV